MCVRHATRVKIAVQPEEKGGRHSQQKSRVAAAYQVLRTYVHTVYPKFRFFREFLPPSKLAKTEYIIQTVLEVRRNGGSKLRYREN